MISFKMLSNDEIPRWFVLSSFLLNSIAKEQIYSSLINKKIIQFYDIQKNNDAFIVIDSVFIFIEQIFY